MSAARGSAPRRRRARAVGHSTVSSSIVEWIRSIAISRYAGPGVPVVAARHACSTYSGMRSRWCTRRAHLVTGRTTSSWSSVSTSPLSGPRGRRGAGDHEHRRALRVRGGDAGERVGESGPGRDERDARIAGGERPAFGAVRGGGLVANVDDANAVSRRRPPGRVDVAAAEPEQVGDAVLRERAGDELAAVDGGHGAPASSSSSASAYCVDARSAAASRR